MTVDRNPTPPETDEPGDFIPEAGEFEPAGGIVKKPPAPSGDDRATEDTKP